MKKYYYGGYFDFPQIMLVIPSILFTIFVLFLSLIFLPMIIMLLPALGTFIIFRKYMRIILINEDLIYSPARIFGQLTYKNKYYNSSYPGTQTTYCFSIDNIKNIEKLDKIVKFEFKKPLEFKPYFKSGFEFGIGKPERPIIKSYSVKVNNPEELINDIKKLRLKK